MVRTRTVNRDRHFQYIQLAIVKASAALTATADKLLNPSYRMDNGSLLTTVIDTLALLGHAHSQLGYRRRDAIIPDLNKMYQGLSSSDVPFTQQLFGDDVLKTMADIKRAKDAKYAPKRYSSAPKNFSGPRDRGQKYQYKAKRGHQYKHKKFSQNYQH